MMVCSHCGKLLPAGASFCAVCKAPGMAPLKTAAAAADWSGPGARPAYGAEAARAAQAGDHAGFWLRFLAYLVDSIVVSVFTGFVSVFTLGAGMRAAAQGTGSAAAGAPFGFLVAGVATWLYFAGMESSGRQATLGKLALGLAVTDADGDRIGFGRATGRWFGKALSAAVAGLGFLAAGFTRRKQALHDVLAGTLVVRRGRSGAAPIVAIAVAGVFAGITVLGILAAVAIPNLLRYQLRVKQAEGPLVIAAIAAGERLAQRERARFEPLDVPAGAVPGRAKLEWSADDLAAAERVGLSPRDGTYFTYRVTVETAADGRQAFSVCAESDLDGDGRFAAYVLWQPTVNEAGNAHAPPPVPPCAHGPELGRALAFGRGDPIAQPVRISPADVF